MPAVAIRRFKSQLERRIKLKRAIHYYRSIAEQDQNAFNAVVGSRI
jgi:hypothetical protein